jgi:hypothetical protein
MSNAIELCQEVVAVVLCGCARTEFLVQMALAGDR